MEKITNKRKVVIRDLHPPKLAKFHGPLALELGQGLLAHSISVFFPRFFYELENTKKLYF